MYGTVWGNINMKYRICENGFDQYKIQYKYPFTLWWWDLKKRTDYVESYSPQPGKKYPYCKWGLRLFDTFEEAERFIMWEKERQETDTKRTKLKTSWQCLGEY